MITIIKCAATSLAVAFAALCGTAIAAPGPPNDEPVCEQGVWATQETERKYVCLSWRFRGQAYTLDQLEVVLAELGRPMPVVLEPPPDESTPTQKREARQRNTDAPIASPKPRQTKARARHDDDDDDDDC